MDALENKHYFSVHYDTINYSAGNGMADYLRQFWQGARFQALGYEVATRRMSKPL